MESFSNFEQCEELYFLWFEDSCFLNLEFRSSLGQFLNSLRIILYAQCFRNALKKKTLIKFTKIETNVGGVVQFQLKYCSRALWCILHLLKLFWSILTCSQSKPHQVTLIIVDIHNKYISLFTSNRRSSAKNLFWKNSTSCYNL